MLCCSEALIDIVVLPPWEILGAAGQEPWAPFSVAVAEAGVPGVEALAVDERRIQA